MSILSHYQRFCRRINHQHRSEIINKKRRCKFDEAMISNDFDILKMKKKKEILTREMNKKYLVHRNTKNQKQEKKTK